MAAIAAPPERVATGRAFDSVSGRYDQDNRANVLLEAMRTRSLQMLRAHVAGGARVLDLGCGPGTDFQALLHAGYHVTAIDASARMVEAARAAAAALTKQAAIDVQHLAIEDVARLAPSRFDAAYSSLGPLNCVIGLDRAAAALAERLRPGGVLVASVIGRLCPWEIACFVMKGNLRRATVRFSRGPVPVPIGAETIWTQYYSPARFEALFARAGFRRVGLRALGLVVPPPYMDAAARRRPRLTATLRRIEDRIAAWPVARSAGDHFLIVLRRA